MSVIAQDVNSRIDEEDKDQEFDSLLLQITNNQYVNDKLQLQGGGINDSLAIELASALESNHYIKTVNLESNKINNKGAEALSRVKLMSLNLACNNIGPEGAYHLSNSEIIFLDLTANPITPTGATYFKNSPFIKTLILSECAIADIGSRAILQNTNLTMLDISTNKISQDGISALPNNSALIELDLSQNRIGQNGVAHIARSNTLERVRLNSNYIGDEGAKEFIQNKQISTLFFMQNNITGKGLSYLCENTKIQRLELYNNRISFDENDVLPQNKSLIELGLRGNELDDKSVNALQQLVSIPTLEQLDLSYNNINLDTAKLLYSFKSSSLKRINLQDNQIEDSDLINNFLKCRSINFSHTPDDNQLNLLHYQKNELTADSMEIIEIQEYEDKSSAQQKKNNCTIT